MPQRPLRTPLPQWPHLMPNEQKIALLKRTVSFGLHAHSSLGPDLVSCRYLPNFPSLQDFLPATPCLRAENSSRRRVNPFRGHYAPLIHSLRRRSLLEYSHLRETMYLHLPSSPKMANVSRYRSLPPPDIWMRQRRHLTASALMPFP